MGGTLLAVVIILHSHHSAKFKQINYIFDLVSVAKGPKFRPQITKRAEKNLMGPGKTGAEFLPDLSKRAEKGPNFF
jgi:hypothetical protein